jgi:hypothetical protein
LEWSLRVTGPNLFTLHTLRPFSQSVLTLFNYKTIKTMYKQTNPYAQYLGTVLLSLSILACQREQVDTNPGADQKVLSQVAISGSENTKSPSAHIEASEKLQMPASIELPANLPAGNSRVATFFAEGVQKYKAREAAGSNPLRYEWAFVAPQADLYDATNAKVGTHSAGPTWQLSPNDSIYAQQFSPARKAASPDPESIDWLLLMPKTGTTPTGIFSDVAYIQRIATKGGKAPLTPPTRADQTVEVKYKAVYRFTKKNGE